METEIALQWNMGFNNVKPPDAIARVSILKELINAYNPSVIALQEAPDRSELLGQMPSKLSSAVWS